MFVALILHRCVMSPACTLACSKADMGRNVYGWGGGDAGGKKQVYAS